MPTAFSRDTQYTCSNRIAEFPIFNRQQIGQIQSLEELSKYMKNFDQEQLVDALSDFHLLLYLATNDTVSMQHVSFSSFVSQNAEITDHILIISCIFY